MSTIKSVTSYLSVRWGSIRQARIPNAIFRDGTLALSAVALKVYTALLHTYNVTPKQIRLMYPDATVRVSQERLEPHTGYGRRGISRGTSELKSIGYVSSLSNLYGKRSRKGKLQCQEYILLDPKWGNVLEAGSESHVLYTNKVSYFTIPRCLVTDHEKRWSMAQLTGSQFMLYLTIAWRANRERANRFSLNRPELRKASGMSPVTLDTTLEELDDLGLILISSETLELCDPYTGYPLPDRYDDEHDNPQNYFTQDGKGRDRRLDVNLDYKNPAELDRFIRSNLGYKGQVIQQGNRDLAICCPFHDDTHPSLSISVKKCGCWHCFGGSCKRSGSLFDLAQGFKAATYRDPDGNAEAKYDYRDEAGTLLYQVLRYRDADGEKRFNQRQRAPGGGWAWHLHGVERTLYNLPQLRFARTVILCEGEKDADTATALQITDTSGLNVIGTTSGGSDSWMPAFARYFTQDGVSAFDQRVIVMPDADEAGLHWTETVTPSLAAEGIEYRVVSFADAGCKDLTEFMANHTVQELIVRCGDDWLRSLQVLDTSDFRP
jgi:hypothetical protein